MKKRNNSLNKLFHLSGAEPPWRYLFRTGWPVVSGWNTDRAAGFNQSYVGQKGNTSSCFEATTVYLYVYLRGRLSKYGTGGRACAAVRKYNLYEPSSRWDSPISPWRQACLGYHGRRWMASSVSCEKQCECIEDSTLFSWIKSLWADMAIHQR